MNINRKYFHFFNDIKIFLQMYYDAQSINKAYDWCEESMNTVPLYTVIRVLNTSIIYFRQFINTDTDLFTDKYYSIMIKIINKFYNTTSSIVNKNNIADISREIMIADQHDPPVQLSTIDIPMKYKIAPQHSQVVYQIIVTFKSKHLRK